jgi:hypothetical protein
MRTLLTGSGDAGSFEISRKADGVLVVIAERLELVPAPYYSGHFLYVSLNNSENRDFLLHKTVAKACK